MRSLLSTRRPHDWNSNATIIRYLQEHEARPQLNPQALSCNPRLDSKLAHHVVGTPRACDHERCPVNTTSAIPPPPRYPTTNGLPPTTLETANILHHPEGPEYRFQVGEGQSVCCCRRAPTDTFIQAHTSCATIYSSRHHLRILLRHQWSTQTHWQPVQLRQRQA